MKRVFKNIAAALAGLMIATAVVPQVLFNEVRADYYDPIEINESNFPDPNLLKFLQDIDKNASTSNKNGKIDWNETCFLSLECKGLGIKSIQGLDKLPQLMSLYCDDNNIKSIDLGTKVTLYSFTCSNNGLTSIKFNPVSLTNFDCSQNRLTSLDLSGCTKLRSFNCRDNRLSSLNLSNCTKLEGFNCSFNELENLDVSKNADLKGLYCSDNYLTSLNLSNCKNLGTLYCQNNEITFLNLSVNTQLKEVKCGNNKLTSLNLSNLGNLEELDCSLNKLTNLNVSSAVLEIFNCANNQLSSLDISKLTKLARIDCSNNKLTNLDTKNNTNLYSVCCRGNLLTSFTAYRRIHSVDVSKNKLTSLNLKDGICDLYCNDNQLASLTIPGTELQRLHCYNNKLTEIKNIEKQTGLDAIAAYGNNIASIQINGTFLKNISCFRIAINSAKISENPVINSSDSFYCISDDGIAYANYMGYHSFEYSSKLPYVVLPNGKTVYYYESLVAVDTTTTVSGTDYMPKVTPTATPTPTPTPKPTAAPTGIEGFATRLYTSCLGRSADKTGLDYWVKELKAGKSGSEAAYKFFFSDELTKKNISNDEFIKRLYRTFMDREADTNGLNYWRGQFASGKTRLDVFNGFVKSTEWKTVCQKYGINPGSPVLVAPTITPTPVPTTKPSGVETFVTRLYTTCLGRTPDSTGLVNWVAKLKEHKTTGTEAAHGFFFSREFTSKNYSNDEFIRRLYRTFMGREADANGLAYWQSKFKSGYSREQVFQGFAKSAEFEAICKQYGILR